MMATEAFDAAVHIKTVDEARAFLRETIALGATDAAVADALRVVARSESAPAVARLLAGVS